MIRVVSWNIAKQHQPWRELAAMDADIALVQEGGQPPENVSGVDIGPKESYDSHHWNSDWWKGRGWPHLYERWPMVVKLSDRVDVEWFKQVTPITVGCGNPDEIAVSGIGIGSGGASYTQRMGQLSRSSPFPCMHVGWGRIQAYGHRGFTRMPQCIESSPICRHSSATRIRIGIA